VKKLNLYQAQNLDTLRKQGDVVGDQTAKFLFEYPDWIETFNSWEALPQFSEMQALPEPLSAFLMEFRTTPTWLNPKKVKMAQVFFEKQGNLYLSLLGFYSLPYCYAFADGAQVLVRSKRITDEIGMRLAETALFLLDSFRPGTFLGNEEAKLTLAKVRLIHAFSRLFIIKYAKDWKKDWGMPINQEDMIGTNLAFSLLVMRGMEKLDRYPGREMSEAVMHYWKVIGHYLGIDTAYWPETAKEAFELEKMIRKRHLRTSDAGIILIQALLKYYQTTVPDPSLANRTASLVAYFVGQEASEALQLTPGTELPKALYGLLLDLSFFRQNGPGTSYEKTRRIFFEQSKLQFGRVPKLLLPSKKRS
jgi:hypothetical protein